MCCFTKKQFVVDATNAFRNKGANSFLEALRPFGPRIAERAKNKSSEPLLSVDELEQLKTRFANSLWARSRCLVPLLNAVGADFLLFVLDEWKEVLSTLSKGRVENTFEDVKVSPHDTGNC